MIPLLEFLLILLEVRYALHFNSKKSASMDMCHTVPGPTFPSLILEILAVERRKETGRGSSSRLLLRVYTTKEAKRMKNARRKKKKKGKDSCPGEKKGVVQAWSRREEGWVGQEVSSNDDSDYGSFSSLLCWWWTKTNANMSVINDLNKLTWNTKIRWEQ